MMGFFPQGAVPGRPVVSAGDPFWSDVVLLLGDNETGNGVAATAGNSADLSSFAHSITIVGAPSWTNTGGPVGVATWLAFNGSQGIQVADNAVFAFAADYIMEGLFNPGLAGGTESFVGIGRADGTDDAFSLTSNPNGFLTDMGQNLSHIANTSDLYGGAMNPTTLVPSTATYWATYRSGANLYFAYAILSGSPPWTTTVLTLSAAASGSIADVGVGPFIGVPTAATGGLAGNMGSTRFTRSTTRGHGASGYTVPTFPFPHF